jgi:hypothetical protein
MKITIDPEGAEYTAPELMTLFSRIQEAWMLSDRGLIEVFSMRVHDSLKDTNKQDIDKE